MHCAIPRFISELVTHSEPPINLHLHAPAVVAKPNLQLVLRRLFRRPVDARELEIIETLRMVPHFSELPNRTLRTLVDYVHVRDYRPDEFIYYDGDPGIGLFIVARGRVGLVLEEFDGSLHEVRSVATGEIFGELAVLPGARRMETARAIEDTRVLGIFQPDIQTLIKRHPKAGANLLMAFSSFFALRQAALIRNLTRDEGRLTALRRFDGLDDDADFFRPDRLSMPVEETGEARAN